MGRADRLIHAARRLSERAASLRFAAPVTHVYDPLRHAGRGYRRYVRRFGEGRKRVVFLGMNPGPWGMTQTGVPFDGSARVLVRRTSTRADPSKASPARAAR